MSKKRRVVIGLVAIAIAYAGYWAYLRWRVHAVYQRAHAAGYPITRAELDAWYVKPDGVNPADAVLAAAPTLTKLHDRAKEGEDGSEYYDQALDELISNHATKPDGAGIFARAEALAAERMARDGVVREAPIDTSNIEIPLSHERLPDDVRKLLQRLVEPAHPTLDTLYAIEGNGSARYPVDFTVWPESVKQSLEHLVGAREACHYLVWDAVLRADSGDSAGAATSVTAAFRAAASLADEPTLMSQLVRIACLRIALEGFAQTVTRIQIDGPALDKISIALAHADPPDAITRAYAGEVCLMGGHFEIEADRMTPLLPELDDLKPSYWSWRLLYEIPYKLAGMERWDELSAIKSIEYAIQIAALEPDERLDGVKRLRRIAESSELFIGVWPPPFPYLGVYAQGVVCVEKYRLLHGDLPQQTQDLFSEPDLAWPLDPFGDGPLEFRRLEVGYSIRGAGDDSGDLSLGAAPLKRGSKVGTGLVVAR